VFFKPSDEGFGRRRAKATLERSKHTARLQVIEEASERGALVRAAGAPAPPDVKPNDVGVNVTNAEPSTLQPVAEATDHLALVADGLPTVAELGALGDERVKLRAEQPVSVPPQDRRQIEVLFQHVVSFWR
jgi:hypothetical protein